MRITINTKSQVFQTIGHTEKFEPVLFFKIGQRKKAISDLTNYFNRFDKYLSFRHEIGVAMPEEEYILMGNAFEEKAKEKAMEVIDRCVFYKDRFFTFLPPAQSLSISYKNQII